MSAETQGGIRPRRVRWTRWRTSAKPYGLEASASRQVPPVASADQKIKTGLGFSLARDVYCVHNRSLHR